MAAGGGSTQVRQKHDLNQQQDLHLDTNSTLRTLKLKYAKAMVRGNVLGKGKRNMAVDYRTKTNTQ